MWVNNLPKVATLQNSGRLNWKHSMDHHSLKKVISLLQAQDVQPPNPAKCEVNARLSNVPGVAWPVLRSAYCRHWVATTEDHHCTTATVMTVWRSLCHALFVYLVVHFIFCSLAAFCHANFTIKLNWTELNTKTTCSPETTTRKTKSHLATTVQKNLKPLNFRLVTACRKATNRDDCQAVVDTAKLRLEYTIKNIVHIRSVWLADQQWWLSVVQSSSMVQVCQCHSDNSSVDLKCYNW